MPRRPIPNNMKHLTGTYRPDRALPDISGTPIPPECPDWLSDRAKAHWKTTLAHLQSLGVNLHPADQDCLATYCSLFARQMDDPGCFGPSLVSQLRAIWVQFGLTPMARETLGIDTRPKQPNRFD